MATQDDALIQFPCDFPIKIVGVNSEHFIEHITNIVQAHDPSFDASRLTSRRSSGARYTAVTCTIRAISQAQLDALYRALSQHPDVKWTL